jgi:hypothetical protein
MEQDPCDEDLSIESELAATIKYVDLYLRQKTDLFLQNYVFEPFDFLAKKLMFLSVIITLLAAGTLVVLAGVILALAMIVPLWAAFLITGAIIFVTAGVIAYAFFSNKIILKTPTTTEMMTRGKI